MISRAVPRLAHRVAKGLAPKCQQQSLAAAGAAAGGGGTSPVPSPHSVSRSGSRRHSSSDAVSESEKGAKEPELYARFRNVMNLFEQRSHEDNNTFVAPNAHLVGQVRIIDHASVWHGAVVRGDNNTVDVGAYTSIGEKAVLNTVSSLKVDTGFSSQCSVGDFTIVEPGAVLTSCDVGHHCVIGHNAVVEEGAFVRHGGRVQAGCVVPAGTVIPECQEWGGNPIRYVKEVSLEEANAHRDRCEAIALKALRHKNELQFYNAAYLDAEKEAKKGEQASSQAKASEEAAAGAAAAEPKAQPT